ncbi:MAG: pseudouridine synthase, partial [Pseudomonadota bacterium]
GRLDKNTSGLLLLTNDGELARELELPSNNYERVYLVRVFGRLNFKEIQNSLKHGITIDGIKYKPIKIEQVNDGAMNNWIQLTISEGKNREIRKILSYFDLKISRLMRIKYGPYILGNLKPGECVLKR